MWHIRCVVPLIFHADYQHWGKHVLHAFPAMIRIDADQDRCWSEASCSVWNAFPFTRHVDETLYARLFLALFLLCDFFFCDQDYFFCVCPQLWNAFCRNSHTQSACISMYQPVSVYKSIFQHELGYVSLYRMSACVSMSACISSSACISLYKHVSVFFSLCGLVSASISLYKHVSVCMSPDSWSWREVVFSTLHYSTHWERNPPVFVEEEKARKINVFSCIQKNVSSRIFTVFSSGFLVNLNSDFPALFLLHQNAILRYGCMHVTDRPMTCAHSLSTVHQIRYSGMTACIVTNHPAQHFPTLVQR